MKLTHSIKEKYKTSQTKFIVFSFFLLFNKISLPFDCGNVFKLQLIQKYIWFTFEMNRTIELTKRLKLNSILLICLKDFDLCANL